MIFLSVAIPLGSAILIYGLASVFRRVAAQLSDIIGNIASASLLILSVLWVVQQHVHGPVIYHMGGWRTPIGINLVLDGLSGLIVFTISIVSFLVTLYSIDYMKTFTSKAKYYTLLLFMIAGMNGVALSGDIFNLYVFMEIAAIASYSLVAFSTEHESLEAAFKYMVLGGIASALILFGIATIYASTGHLNMAYISRFLAEGTSRPLVFFCSVLFMFGFGL